MTDPRSTQAWDFQPPQPSDSVPGGDAPADAHPYERWHNWQDSGPLDVAASRDFGDGLQPRILPQTGPTLDEHNLAAVQDARAADHPSDNLQIGSPYRSDLLPRNYKTQTFSISDGEIAAVAAGAPVKALNTDFPVWAIWLRPLRNIATNALPANSISITDHQITAAGEFANLANGKSLIEIYKLGAGGAAISGAGWLLTTFDRWIPIPNFIAASSTGGGGGVVTFAGQVVEDNPSANADPLLAIAVVRKDVPTNLVSADGDYAVLEIDNLGRLWTHDDLAITQMTTLAGVVKAEDVPSANADPLLPVAVVRKDVPTSLVSADGDYAVLQESPLGELWTRSVSPTVAVTSVGQNVASQVLLAANASRKMGTVFNDSAANLYINLGAAAVIAGPFVVKVPAGGYYELPAPAYSGSVNGIWDAAGAGNARVSEQT